MKRAMLDAINDARRGKRAVVRAVDLASGEERLIDIAKAGDSPLERAAVAAACTDKSAPFESDGKSWFLAVYNPPLDLAIVGAAHIAQMLAQMAALAGYRVRIIDPRTAFATAE